jgi:hypothetical protein
MEVFMSDVENSFVKHIIGIEQRILMALVYSARAQGFRAGVKPYTGSQDEGLPPIKRAVYIEYPEKTIEWTYTELSATFLDSLPQYEN